jgi:glycosyltransferase involved in cell wall biosynthesis
MPSDPTAPVTAASPAPAPQHDVPRLGFDWEVGGSSGWGIYGFQLALHSALQGAVRPVLLAPPDRSQLSPLVRAALRPVLHESASVQAQRGGGGALRVPFTVLRALANQMQALTSSDDIRAPRNVGMLVFEDTHFDRPTLARTLAYDYLVTPSRWNTEVVKGYGIDTVGTSMQGVDPTIFHEAPRLGLFGGRFAVFSGGKLEYRKGQDLVAAAFRLFHARHPDALLVTAWHNHWPGLMAEIGRAGHVEGVPEVQGGRLALREWLAANRIPPAAVVDVGVQPNIAMGAILREADVAVFPNRCEGGTNLVAMEAMACGLPTILSANTGHLDLLGGHCLALRDQRPVPGPTAMFRGTAGWGESSVEEIVEALEVVYASREEAARLGREGAAFMRAQSWAASTRQFLGLIGPWLS